MPAFMTVANATVRNKVTGFISALPTGRQLPPEAWQRRHRFIVALLLAHVAGVFVFAIVRGHPALHSAMEAAILMAFAAIAANDKFKPGVRSVSATVGLLTSSALLVHFSGGVIEMHFHFFVMVAVVSLYQHWTPFLVAIGYVVLQHGTVGILFPDGVYNHPAAQADPWTWAGIHGFFIAGESIACLVYWKMAEESTTAKAAAERMLAATQERFRQAFESSALGMLLTKVDGTVVEVNESFYEMLGYNEAEFRQLNWIDVIHPDDMEEITTLAIEILDGHSDSGSMLIRFRHLGGHDVWTQITFGLVNNADENERYFMAQANDVTEMVEAQKRQEVLEDQLRQAQKMEAVGHLTGGIAHDFNNLIGVISNFATFAMDGLDETSPAADDIKEVQAAAKRARELTRQLLTFSRKEMVKPVVLDLRDTVSDFQKILRSTLSEDIELETDVAADVWHTKVDPSHVEQVLMNLAVNARDAMPQGGKLSIAVRNVILDEEYAAIHPGLEPGEFVSVAVSDNGLGMTHEVQCQMFEPFFTTKDRASGTGLGMSTVYGIVKQAGGYITVYSELGLGTTVKVYLPRTTEAICPPTSVAEPVDRSGHEVVLVVEDEPRLLSVAKRILTNAGYDVITAASGPEALDLLDSSTVRPDLLITDIVMPKMSGRELSERTALPTVFMSGYDDSILNQQGSIDPNLPFVQKPFTRDDLLTAVRQGLDSRDVTMPSRVNAVSRPRRILVIDDELSMLEVLDLLIAHNQEGVEVSRAQDSMQALRLAREVHPSIIILDYMIPNTDVEQLAGMLREIVPDASILLFSGATIDKPEWADAFLMKSKINELGALVADLIKTHQPINA
ncbi:MAG: response regulator [Actinomycetota bacterium]